jgi:hypothetical protein
MLKKRNISVYSDFKTGFFCKILLFLGFILIFFYVIQWATNLISIDENVSGIILAFSILFLGIGIILYFFNCQFAKLSEIADEVENENKSEDLGKSGDK